MKVFRLYRDEARGSAGDSRAYLELDPEEGLMLRVDDDYYDCEMSRPEAVELARAILAEFAPS